MSPLECPREPPNEHGSFLPHKRQSLEGLGMWWGIVIFNITLVTLRGRQTCLRINSVRESFSYLNFSGGTKVPEKLCLPYRDQVGTTEQGDIVPNSRSHEKSPHLGHGTLGRASLHLSSQGLSRETSAFPWRCPASARKAERRYDTQAMARDGGISSSAEHLSITL